MDVVLDTKDTCFLCRKQFPWATKKDDKQEINSLKEVCRYLKINTTGVLLQSLKDRLDPEEVVKWAGKEYNLWGKFCQDCGEVQRGLSKYLDEMNVLQIRIKDSLEMYLEILGQLAGDSGSSADDRLAELLREEVKWKCAEKVEYLERTALPIVPLTRIDGHIGPSRLVVRMDNESNSSVEQDDDEMSASEGEELIGENEDKSDDTSSENSDSPTDPATKSTPKASGTRKRKRKDATFYTFRVLRSEIPKKNKVTVPTNGQAIQETSRSPQAKPNLAKRVQAKKRGRGRPRKKILARAIQAKKSTRTRNQYHAKTVRGAKSRRLKIEGNRRDLNGNQTKVQSERSSPENIDLVQGTSSRDRHVNLEQDEEIAMTKRIRTLYNANCIVRQSDGKYQCGLCRLLCSRSRFRYHLTDDHADKLLDYLRQKQVSKDDFRKMCKHLFESLIRREKRGEAWGNSVWVCALCDIEYNYCSGANKHLLVCHPQELSKSLMELQQQGSRSNPVVVARTSETDKNTVLLKTKIKERIKSVMNDQCERTTELGFNGRKKYLCGLCNGSICNTKIRTHLAGYHPEKLLDFVKQPHFSDEDFAKFCEHMLNEEQSKLESKVRSTVHEHNKKRARYVQVCSFCNTEMYDSRFVRYHLIMCHIDVLVKKLEEIQEEGIPVLTRNESGEAMETSTRSSDSGEYNMPVLKPERCASISPQKCSETHTDTNHGSTEGDDDAHNMFVEESTMVAPASVQEQEGANEERIVTEFTSVEVADEG